jgi:hypothetical protein
MTGEFRSGDGKRSANIRQLHPGDTCPWNVGLYDETHGDPTASGYVESFAADTHAQAIQMADAWVNFDDARLEHLSRAGS